MTFFQIWFWVSVWIAVAGLNLWWFWAAKQEPHECTMYLTEEQMWQLVTDFLEQQGAVSVERVDVGDIVPDLIYHWTESAQARADRLTDELLGMRQRLVDDQFKEITGRFYRPGKGDT